MSAYTLYAVNPCLEAVSYEQPDNILHRGDAGILSFSVSVMFPSTVELSHDNTEGAKKFVVITEAYSMSEGKTFLSNFIYN
jgi:hypothetical protein